MLVSLLAQDPPKTEPTAPVGAMAVPLIIMVVMLVVMSSMSGRRQKKEQQKLLENLKIHDKVVTHSGILGSVANIADTEVTLKVDETTNSRMRVLKSSIASVIKIADEPKEVK